MKGQGWTSKEVQQARFKELVKLFELTPSFDVLDVGCGLGDFSDYLRKQGLNYKYTGIDREDFYINNSNKNLKKADLFEYKEIHDFVVASGTFNLNFPNIAKGITAMWDLSNKGISFNFLTEPIEQLQHHDKNQIVEFCKTLTSLVDVYEGYLKGDATVVMMKETPEVMKKFTYQALEVVRQDVELEINKNIVITKDSKVQEASAAFWDKTFEGLTKLQSNKVKQIILRGISSKKTIDKIKEQIQRELGLDEEQAQAIAGTEHQAITNKLREITFTEDDPEGEYKFKWLSIPDYRRTKICENITDRTKNGVTMEKLKEIIHEESIAGGFDGEREFTSHPNCRSIFSRFFP